MYNLAFVALILSGVYGLHAAVGNLMDVEKQRVFHIEKALSDFEAQSNISPR